MELQPSLMLFSVFPENFKEVCRLVKEQKSLY